jgi:hypothetical protein
MPKNDRQLAGERNRRGGHAFAERLSDRLGPPARTVLSSRSKADIVGHPILGNLSVKNPTGKNTQVFLTAPHSFKNELSLPEEVCGFVDLFFGHPTTEGFDELLTVHRISREQLSPELELSRKRVLANHIPGQMVKRALDWFNESTEVLFRSLFTKGYPNWEHEAQTLAWAFQKNKLESVKFYSLDSLYQTFKLGRWSIPSGNSVLWYSLGEERFLHLQMKGSGDRLSWSYHSLMFHLHSPLLLASKAEIQFRLP